ncbi:hypothetical protein EBS57_09590 [bacterium]|nr:hypothetical protein [bacterium]
MDQVKHRQQVVPVGLVVVVVVGGEWAMLPVREILLQQHLVKEIMVEQEQAVMMAPVAEVAVPEVWG